MKYVADDSTAFWAIGSESSVIAKHAEFCGKEVEMVVPFEGANSGEVKCAYPVVFYILSMNGSIVSTLYIVLFNFFTVPAIAFC